MSGFRKVVHRRAMPTANRGFTLIELIVVITILGILAAVALPRFTALQADARKAKADAIFGSVRAAAGITKATAVVQGLDCSSAAGVDVKLEGVTIPLSYCYPAAATAGIIAAANLSEDGDGLAVIVGTDSSTPPLPMVTIRIDGKTDCNITYVSPEAADEAPKITNNATVARC